MLCIPDELVDVEEFVCAIAKDEIASSVQIANIAFLICNPACFYVV